MGMRVLTPLRGGQDETEPEIVHEVIDWPFVL